MTAETLPGASVGFRLPTLMMVGEKEFKKMEE